MTPKGMGTNNEYEEQEVKDAGDTWKSSQFVVCIRPRPSRNKRSGKLVPDSQESTSSRNEVKVGRSRQVS